VALIRFPGTKNSAKKIDRFVTKALQAMPDSTTCAVIELAAPDLRPTVTRLIIPLKPRRRHKKNPKFL
jgi:hypothetical protein